MKIQSDAIILKEISQDLDKLVPRIKFGTARKLLTEITRRLKRIIAPLRTDPALVKVIQPLEGALDLAKEALQSVKPTGPSEERNAPNAVYNAIEAPFSAIDDLVAQLCGLLDKKAMHFGEDKQDGDS